MTVGYSSLVGRLCESYCVTPEARRRDDCVGSLADWFIIPHPANVQWHEIPRTADREEGAPGAGGSALLPASGFSSVSAARHTADRPSLASRPQCPRRRLDLRSQGSRDVASARHTNHCLNPSEHIRHGLPATHISRSGRPSLEQRPARCWQQGAPAWDRTPAAGYPRPRPPRSGTPQQPGPSVETAGRAYLPAGKEGAPCVLLDRTWP